MLVRLPSSCCKSRILKQLHSFRPRIANNVNYGVITSSMSPCNFMHYRLVSTTDSALLTSIDSPTPSIDTTSSAQNPNQGGLPFFVGRTKSKQLPIYESKKRGGNLLITTVNHISGDFQKLNKQLQQRLDVTSAAITIKQENNKILIKGHHKSAIKEFLEEKKF